MSSCVDLTSDGDSPYGKQAGPPKAVASPCILLSSDEEPSQKKQKLSGPSQLENVADEQSLSLTFDKRAEEAGSQALPSTDKPAPAVPARQGRPKRVIKKAYGDDFDYDLDFGGSQSQGLADQRMDQQDDPPFQTQQSVGLGSPSNSEPAGSRPSKANQYHPCQGTIEPSRATCRQELDVLKRCRKSRGRLTEEEKAEREAEKERKKQERIAAREEKKRQKEAEKVEKQAQRAQQRLDRKRETGKTALADLVVHLDPDFAKHRAGREVMQRLEDSFGEAGVDGPGLEVGQRLPMWPLKSATWSRNVYKPSDVCQPASQSLAHRQTVDYTLVYFTAEEFVNKVAEDDLRSVVQQAARGCPECTLCFMVDGLEHYLTLRQRREFQANGPGGGGFNRAFVDHFLGGMATRWPGVRHVVVHDTAQAAEHFAGITRALAEQPYRAEVAYVMSFGAGKPDSNAMHELLKKAPLPHKDREVWFKALSCIPKLGPQAAHAVSSQHSSLGSLIQSYQSCVSSTAQKEGMLQELIRYGGSRVGPAASRSVFQILTSDDPNICL